MKILLVHTPQIYREGSPLSGGMFVYIMAMGLFSLASELAKAGHDVRIIHTGLETLADSEYSHAGLFSAEKPDMVGFSLNWHPQIYESIETARALKSVLPNVPVFMGGFTASVFAEELLRDFADCVDFIIRGDGEVPALMLAEAVSRNESFESIPNLLYRRDGQILSSRELWAPSTREFSAFDFANFNLLKNAAHYISPYLVPPGSTLASLASHRIFYLATSRGCTVNCAFCGGGQNAHRQYFHRSGPLFRDIEAVLETMESVLRFGWNTFYICFKMPDDDKVYYPSLFDAIGKRFGRRKIKLLFESALLPCERSLETFASVFDLDGSQIILSPTSNSEETRRRFLGSFYSNSELEDFLGRARGVGVAALLYYSILPGQNIEATKELIRHQTALEKQYGALCQTMPIELEPGAPWALHPESFNLKLLRRTALDYYEHHRRMSCQPVSLIDRVGFDDVNLETSYRFFEAWTKKRNSI